MLQRLPLAVLSIRNDVKCGLDALRFTLLFFVLLACHHTTKAEMVGAGVRFTLAASTDNIAGTVLVGAKLWAAAMPFLGLVRFGRVVRAVGPLWVTRHATGRRHLLVIVGAIPIAGPLPSIARHII